MTTAIAVATVLAFSFALGSLIRMVDGATLRRWRLSRRWDVSRLAREFIKAADEPLATLRGLTHMINAWERGVRRPSERYWLLYLRVFPECADGEMVIGSAEANATDAPDFSSEPSVDLGDIHALAATVKDLEQQIAGIAKRLDELSGAGDDKRQSRARNQIRKSRPNYRRANWTPLWSLLVPVLN